MYSAPAESKRRSPIECVWPCWHQSSISTCSLPTIWLPWIWRRESRALVTQPCVFPGGVGQLSLNVGAVPPIGASWV